MPPFARVTARAVSAYEVAGGLAEPAAGRGAWIGIMWTDHFPLTLE